jgi:hypothetical protein
VPHGTEPIGELPHSIIQIANGQQEAEQERANIFKVCLSSLFANLSINFCLQRKAEANNPVASSSKDGKVEKK